MNIDAPDEQPEDPANELLSEYQFDYGKAKPNRFAASAAPGSRLVLLEPRYRRGFHDGGLGQRGAAVADHDNALDDAALILAPSASAERRGSSFPQYPP